MTTKTAHQIYRNQVRSGTINTFSPSSLTQPSLIDYPNLSRGVIHQQHMLTVALTLTITNTNAAAASPALTLNPRGMLAWLTNILYKTNSLNTAWAMPGYEAFMVAMAQAGVNMSAAEAQGPGSNGGDPTKFLLTDFTAAQLNADIPATSSASYTATARIPINWFGTQTAPQAMGFSTVSPAITSFQIQLSTGTAANIVGNLAAGFTAAITAANITMEETYYPYNGDPASLPPWFPQIVYTGGIQTTGAAQKQQLQLPYGTGRVYKRFFIFVRDTTTPFALNSDTVMENMTFVANTDQYLLNNRSANSLKAEYALRYNRALPQGMYIHDRLLHGNILDALDTAGFNSLQFEADLSAAGLIGCYAETLTPNVPLPTPPAHQQKAA
jgi:hypothetical protein